jgi:hypothetical protein
MIPKTVIEDLENEWDQTNGFLGNLRRGIFDSTRGKAHQNALKKSNKVFT